MTDRAITGGLEINLKDIVANVLSAVRALGVVMVHPSAQDVIELRLATGTNPELLKLRGGPGLGYNVILGLPDGTVVLRRDCTTELGELWCRVSLAAALSVTGFVAARYLSDVRF